MVAVPVVQVINLTDMRRTVPWEIVYFYDNLLMSRTHVHVRVHRGDTKSEMKKRT